MMTKLYKHNNITLLQLKSIPSSFSEYILIYHIDASHDLFDVL